MGNSGTAVTEASLNLNFQKKRKNASNNLSFFCLKTDEILYIMSLDYFMIRTKFMLFYESENFIIKLIY